jgi:uncharacterized protein
MRLEDGKLRLSASDLMGFMSCPHAGRLDLDHLHGRGPEPVESSAEAALLQDRGDAHERAYLARLPADSVVSIDRDQPFDRAVEATRLALSTGAPVIYQGALEGGAWGGWSDFLERVNRPSSLGAFSYEIVDTKLKRRATPGHVLQLALYSDLLAAVQGLVPERAHVELGDGTRATVRLAEVSAWCRAARDRMEAFVASPPPTRPVPVGACPLCRWREHCAESWEARDSLFLVAGITRGQAAKLEAAGIMTMSALARHAGSVPRLAELTLERLQLQARLQCARRDGPPLYELRDRVVGKGFDLMPRPDPGDLFYDIEGDPHYSGPAGEGLEYLHGIWDGSIFTAFWAHDHDEERALLARLIDFIDARLRANPRAHLYHYAAYEKTALRRLCARHGLGEAQLDRWLREERFVDLYAVVRGGLAASERSYSLKDLEAFLDIERSGEVKTAGGSVVAYEAWREHPDQAILDEIEDYNRIDCVATEKLRDWLVSIRPEGPWREPVLPQDDRHDEAEEDTAELRARLLSADLPEGRGQMLFDLALFHAREKKPAAWAVFDAAEKESEELCDDMDCLGGLVAVGPAEPVARSVERTYRYPAQETKLRAGKDARLVLADNEAPIPVSITALDRRERRVTVKLGPKWGRELPERLDLLPDFALTTGPIEAAVRRVAEDQLGDRQNRAADDLLARRAPRWRAAPPPLDGPDPVAATIAAVRAMDDSVLPVQGPPGTGKTYVTARAVLALIADGRRIGVMSNSHEAVLNVLGACVDALLERGEHALEAVQIAHKGSRDMDTLPDRYASIHVAQSYDDPWLIGAQVVGGTAWLFSHADFAGAFDHVFIDEAGQVSLANALAATTAGRNLVLVGDQNQLPQVVQGAHPHPAGLSCLEWMLEGQSTIAADRGIFLAETRRMHPDLCAYVSDQFYGGRLRAHHCTHDRRVDVAGLPATGAWLVPVEHDGRAQECPEEIATIRATIDRLLTGRWTDADGTRKIVSEDVIVVAPYNAQVNALADALPGIRGGTVDKFQGQEAAVALISMTASSAEETARGLAFLLSRNRLNVAVSRGKALSLVFAAPRLTETPCVTVEQIRLVNTLCALPRWRMPIVTRHAAPAADSAKESQMPNPDDDSGNSTECARRARAYYGVLSVLKLTFISSDA